MKLILTLGFDEKFAIRAIIRNGLVEGDEIYALLPEGGDPRADKAFDNLKEMINKAFDRVKIERVHVPIGNFALAVNQLRLFLRGLGVGDKILNLSGGQRILIVALLIAASNLDLDVDVEIETEDSRAVHRFPLSIMKVQKLDPLDVSILKSLSKKKFTIGELSTAMGVSRPTVWRRLEKLTSLDLVKKVEKGEYMLSEAGLSMLD
ncbi:MAG: CRISPR-associated CARF protein Csa3 [Candidatus Methanosuratincola sp.]